MFGCFEPFSVSAVFVVCFLLCSPLATRGILDRTVKRAVTFLFLKKGLWITRVPLWIVYEVGNSVQCPKHIRSELSECPSEFRQPCDEDCWLKPRSERCLEEWVRTIHIVTTAGWVIFLLAAEPLLRGYSPTYDNGCTIVSGPIPIVSDGRNSSRTVLCSFQQPLPPLQVWRAICFMPINPLSCFSTTKSVSLLEFPTAVY